MNDSPQQQSLQTTPILDLSLHAPRPILPPESAFAGQLFQGIGLGFSLGSIPTSSFTNSRNVGVSSTSTATAATASTATRLANSSPVLPNTEAEVGQVPGGPGGIVAGLSREDNDGGDSTGVLEGSADLRGLISACSNAASSYKQYGRWYFGGRPSVGGSPLQQVPLMLRTLGASYIDPSQSVMFSRLGCMEAIATSVWSRVRSVIMAYHLNRSPNTNTFEGTRQVSASDLPPDLPRQDGEAQMR